MQPFFTSLFIGLVVVDTLNDLIKRSFNAGPLAVCQHLSSTHQVHLLDAIRQLCPTKMAYWAKLCHNLNQRHIFNYPLWS